MYGIYHLVLFLLYFITHSTQQLGVNVKKPTTTNEKFVILEQLGNSSLLNAIVIVKRTSEDRCQRRTQNVLSVINTQKRER